MDKIFGCILPQSDNQNLLVIYCYFKVVIRIWLINDIYLLSQLQKPWSESKEKHTFSTEWMDFAELFKKKSLQIRYCRSTYYFLMCCIMSAAPACCRWHLCREMQCLASNWTNISTGKCELKYILTDDVIHFNSMTWAKKHLTRKYEMIDISARNSSQNTNFTCYPGNLMSKI